MPPEVFPLEEARVAHGYVGVVDGLGAVSVEVLGEQKYEKKNVGSFAFLSGVMMFFGALQAFFQCVR